MGTSNELQLSFVTGATGFTGREVVRLLREEGVPTVAHVRPDSGRLAQWGERFTAQGAEVDATPWETDAMAQTFARLRPAVVFALYGTTRARMKQAAREGADPAANDYMKVDYGLTMILIQAAQQAGVTPRLVYLSAAGAGKPSLSPYGQARHRADRAVRESGLPFTVVRPSFIVGDGRDEPRPGERYGAALIDGALRLVGALGAKRMEARYRSTTNTVLARALVRLALDPDGENKIFESEQLR